jgi:hypothetical protein
MVQCVIFGQPYVRILQITDFKHLKCQIAVLLTVRYDLPDFTSFSSKFPISPENSEIPISGEISQALAALRLTLPLYHNIALIAVGN